MHPPIQHLSPAAQATGVQLWERETELLRIEAGIGAVCAGGSRILVIEGPAGIGKTQLLLSANRMSQTAGLRVLSARATELERDYPFGIARQWLEPVLVGASAAEREALLEGAAGLAARVLSADSGRSPVRIESALHSLYWALANLSSRTPLMLLLDDAQWADGASLRLLTYLAPRMEGLALGTVITARPPELGEAGALLERLLSDPLAETLHPSALGSQAASEVLVNTTGSEPDPAFVAQAVAATGGNPFYLTELGRAFAADGITPTAEHVDRIATIRPQTLSRAILGRVSGDARALAGALAALDEPADVLLAGETAGLPPDRASRAADELVRAGLLMDARPLEFRHAIVRGAARSGMTAGQRAAIHASAAEALRARGATPERIAIHLLAAEPAGDALVVDVLREAAGRALGRGAPDVAVRMLERAVAEPPPAGEHGAVLAALAGARHRAGMADERTADLYQQAYRLLTDPVRRVELLRDLAWVVGPNRLRQRELEPLFEQAIDELGQTEGMRALTLRLDAAHLTGTLLDGDSRALESRIESLEKLDGSDPAEGALLALLARYKLSTGATASEAAGVVKRAIANPQTLIDEGPDSLWLLNSVVILVQAECLDDAEQLLARAVEQARTLGSVTGYALASIHRARIALRRGAPRDAEAEAHTALDALLEPSWYATSATGMLMDALIQQGRLDEAQVAYDGLGLGEHIPDIRPATPILIVRGLLREQQGDLERAASDLTDALARIARFNVRNAVGLDARLRLIYINRALGAHAAARAVAHDVHEIAAAWGAPGALGEAFRAQAAVAPNGERAIAQLRAAVEQLGCSPARLEHARALADLGSALRRGGQRRESRAPLREALAFAERAGALPLAERAREELAASGMRLRRQSEDRDRLTPSEQRIARLAAEGSTNPQIAQSLFLTIKTVEGHLSSVYRKLEITGRTDLPEALERIDG